MGRFVRAFLSDFRCHEPFVGLAAHEFLMGKPLRRLIEYSKATQFLIVAFLVHIITLFLQEGRM
jgi:hypothetical protein